MKKLFLPVICVLLFCLSGCEDGSDVFDFAVWYYSSETSNPSQVKTNEEIFFVGYKRVDTSGNPWILTFEGLPENFDIEKGKKSEKFSTKKKICVEPKIVDDDSEGHLMLNKKATVRFSFDTPGEYTIKVNAFQDNGQEVAEKYYPQENFTYTITVTE